MPGYTYTRPSIVCLVFPPSSSSLILFSSYIIFCFLFVSFASSSSFFFVFLFPSSFYISSIRCSFLSASLPLITRRRLVNHRLPNNLSSSLSLPTNSSLPLYLLLYTAFNQSSSVTDLNSLVCSDNPEKKRPLSALFSRLPPGSRSPPSCDSRLAYATTVQTVSPSLLDSSNVAIASSIT